MTLQLIASTYPSGSNAMDAELVFNDRYLRINVVGSVTPQALLEVMDQYTADERFNVALGVLWDMRQAKPDNSLRADGIQLAASHVPPTTRPRKVAFLVASDLGYGLSRMAMVFGEDEQRQHEIFRELEAADTWLRAEG